MSSPRLPKRPGAPTRPRKLAVDFTLAELNVLVTLASEQLFRRQFIDPRMPGYRANDEEITLAKTVLGRLRAIVDGARASGAKSAVAGWK